MVATKLVSLVMAGVDLDGTGANGLTALGRACANGHVAAVEVRLSLSRGLPSWVMLRIRWVTLRARCVTLKLGLRLDSSGPGVRSEPLSLANLLLTSATVKVANRTNRDSGGR